MGTKISTDSTPDWLAAFMEQGRRNGIEAARQQGGMTIGEVVEAIEAHLADDWQEWNTPDLQLVSGQGLGEPDSYRGYYDRLAVQPQPEPVDARKFVRELRGCIGETFMGYKGGSYRMDAETLLHVADYGNVGEMVVGVEYVRENEWRGHFVVQTAEET